MERHYILQARIRLRGNDFLSPIGFVCTEGELNGKLKHANAVSYRIKQIDDEPVEGWDKSDWLPVE